MNLVQNELRHSNHIRVVVELVFKISKVNLSKSMEKFEKQNFLHSASFTKYFEFLIMHQMKVEKDKFFFLGPSMIISNESLGAL